MTAPTPDLRKRDTPPVLAGDNLRQLVLFRTIAITGQIITVAFVHGSLEIPLPLFALAGAIGFLALQQSSSIQMMNHKQGNLDSRVLYRGVP